MKLLPLPVHHLHRRALRHESCELAFEGFAHTGAPSFGDGLGPRIGEDLLFSFFQPVEDARGRELGQDLRYVEAAVHVSVDRLVGVSADRQ